MLFIGTPSVTLAQHCPSSQHPDSISVWRTREVVSGSFAPGYSSWEGGSYPRRATHVQSESPGESDCSQFPGGEWNFCSGLLVAVPRGGAVCSGLCGGGATPEIGAIHGSASRIFHGHHRPRSRRATVALALPCIRGFESGWSGAGRCCCYAEYVYFLLPHLRQGPGP